MLLRLRKPEKTLQNFCKVFFIGICKQYLILFILDTAVPFCYTYMCVQTHKK